MANVSFYLIVCYSNSCSACEMSFLTGKECPRKCVYCRSPRQNKLMYYTCIHQDSQKGSKYNIRQKRNLNLICFVSFKNQNREMYCLLTAFYDLYNYNDFWNFWLGQICHVILSHFILGGRGIGGRVRENNAYCFLIRMAHLITFIHNGGI